MMYAKSNKSKLNSLLNDVKSLVNNLNEAKIHVGNFKYTANRKLDGWAGIYFAKNGDSATPTPMDIANGEPNALFYSNMNEVRGYLNNLNTEDSNDLPAVVSRCCEYQNMITNILNLLNNFEDLVSSDELNMSKVMDNLDSLGENYSIETITVDIDGEQKEVQVLMWTDEDGNKYNVSELINAFYTYTGITGSSAVVLASQASNSDELESKLTNLVDSTALGVDTQLQKGFYSVASEAGIAAMYNDATGKDYDQSTVRNDYNSILTKYNIDEDDYNNKLAGVTNAAALGGMAMAGALMAGLNFKLESPSGGASQPSSSGVSQPTFTGGTGAAGVAAAVGGVVPGVTVTVTPTETEEEKTEETPQPEEQEVPVEPENPEIPEEPEEPETPVDPEEPGESDESENPEEPVPEEPEEPEEPELPPREISDEEAEQILKDIEDLNKEEILEEVEKTNRTAEEIDAEARDQYYADTDKLIDIRVQNIEKYEQMTLEEKVSALEDVGYDHDTAVILASDANKGQTAYIVGMDEKELARISNEIAQNEGISELDHDTKYDDGHTLSYVEDGTINLDMSPLPETVHQAREELTLAKYDYDEAVTIANNAINKANTAKDDYENILNAIKEESGEDPRYWTKAQVEEYNNAVSNYNDAVTEANNAKTIVTEKQEVYEREKTEYQTAYDEHINETRGLLDGIDNSTVPDGDSDNDVPVDAGNVTLDDDGNMVI